MAKNFCREPTCPPDCRRTRVIEADGLDAPEPQPVSHFLGNLDRELLSHPPSLHPTPTPANVQVPLGTTGWLKTGQSGQSLAPYSPPAPDLVSCRARDAASQPWPLWHLRGKGPGAAPMPPWLGASLKLSQLCALLT